MIVVLPADLFIVSSCDCTYALLGSFNVQTLDLMPWENVYLQQLRLHRSFEQHVSHNTWLPDLTCNDRLLPTITDGLPVDSWQDCSKEVKCIYGPELLINFHILSTLSFFIFQLKAIHVAPI